MIPLFKKQILRGGPVTVTHLDMVRYFMTPVEAAQLVIQAGALARGGETFILDMGQPVKIFKLAKNLIRLSGLIPEKDILIVFTGKRPGEKLVEQLIGEGEGVVPTRHKRIFAVYEQGIDLTHLERFLENLQNPPFIQKVIPNFKK